MRFAIIVDVPLVRSARPQGDDIDGLRARLTALEGALDERATEIVRLKADLAAFSVKYRQDVGVLPEELD